jgi:hypothetical protein
MSAKTELRRKVAEIAATTEQHKQTHSVFFGKFRVPAWKDGDVIRSLADNSVLARRAKKGWTATVKAVNLPKPGRYDNVVAHGPAIVGSMWDGINKGEFF